MKPTLSLVDLEATWAAEAVLTGVVAVEEVPKGSVEAFAAAAAAAAAASAEAPIVPTWVRDP